MTWGWLVAGAAAILVGAVLWASAFVLVPAGMALLAIGVAKAVRRGRVAATARRSS